VGQQGKRCRALRAEMVNYEYKGFLTRVTALPFLLPLAAADSPTGDHSQRRDWCRSYLRDI